jgi:hypothetical protein
MTAWITALVVALGCGVAAAALAGGGVRGARLLRWTLGLGPGLGLGLASLLLFFCRSLGLPRPGLGSFLLLCAVLAAAALIRRRPPALPEPRRSALPRAVRIAAWLALAVAFASALADSAVISRSWPGGTWDAVALYNSRARILYRGYERAPEQIAELDPSGHPNYPLLLPGAIAAEESFAGAESTAVPEATALAFVLGLGLLVLAVAADSGETALGAAAAAWVLGTPMVCKWGFAQVADLPVAYSFLAGVAVLATLLPGREDDRLPPLLGGFALALLAWTKNEGVVMAMLAAGLFAVWWLATAWRRRDRRALAGAARSLAWIAAGLIPGVAAVLVFKRRWAPDTGLDVFLGGKFAERLLDPERWWIPTREILLRLLPLRETYGWGRSWLALELGLAIVIWLQVRGRRSPLSWAGWWGAALLGTILSWIPIYAVSPYPQMWHISGSLDRLLLQVYPLLAAGLFLWLGRAVAGREPLESAAPAPSPTSPSSLSSVREPLAQSAPTAPDAPSAERRAAWALWTAAAVAGGFLVKAVTVASGVPSIWLWMDELFYTASAWDMAHWGARGTPHPDFLFYPPVTSLLIAPLHLAGLAPPTVYRLSLLVLAAVTSSGVVAGVLLLRRLFGARSRLLPLLLALASPAYTALILMSDPVFATLYAWYLYVYVRMVQERRSRDWLLGGVLISVLMLTRHVGLLLLVSLGVAWIADRYLPGLAGEERRAARSPRLTLLAALPPVATLIAWRLAAGVLRQGQPGTYSFPLYVGVALIARWHLVFGAAWRTLAEIGYVSLSTFGIAVPAALWLLVGRRGRESRAARLTVVHLGAFLLLESGIAALVMFLGRTRSTLPRFDVYGRYVEYFGIPLLAIAIGVCAAVARRGSVRERTALALTALAVNAVCLGVVPARFFAGSLANQIAPNSLGIAWLIEAAGRFGLGVRWLAPPLAALLVWALTAPGEGLRAWPRRAAGIVLIALCLGNFLVVKREISVNSNGSAQSAGLISDFVTAHPEAFARGFYVDYPEYRREVDRAARDNPLALRALADHIDLAIAGSSPESWLGRMPVVTKKTFPGRPVLAEWPGVDYRIYASN